MERLVSREELESPTNSARSSPDYQQISQLLDSQQQFALVQHHDENTPQEDDQQERDNVEIETGNDEDMLDFRLFATAPTSKSSSTKPAIHKIRLASPSPIDPATAGFTVPQRPLSYYFTTEPTSGAGSGPNPRHAEYEQAALSGEQILRLAQIPWPGAAYPWKLCHLPPTGLSRRARLMSRDLFTKLDPFIGDEQGGSKTGRKRTRLGKKSRIIIREKVARAARKAEEIQVAAETRDALERDKRARRNREKKLKRRERERAKKKVGEADGDGAEAGAGARAVDVDLAVSDEDASGD